MVSKEKESLHTPRARTGPAGRASEQAGGADAWNGESREGLAALRALGSRQFQWGRWGKESMQC